MYTESPRETRARKKMDINLLLNLVAWLIYGSALLLLLLYLYTKYCLRLEWRTDRAAQHTAPPLEESHHQSTHTMVATVSDEHRDAINQAAVGPQPNDNHLQELPSYETVCRKDKQGHIYRMIAQRFDITGSNYEPPPTYEESLHQSLQPADVNLPAHAQDESSNLCEATHSLS